MYCMMYWKVHYNISPSILPRVRYCAIFYIGARFISRIEIAGTRLNAALIAALIYARMRVYTRARVLRENSLKTA